MNKIPLALKSFIIGLTKKEILYLSFIIIHACLHKASGKSFELNISAISFKVLHLLYLKFVSKECIKSYLSKLIKHRS